MVAQGKTSLNPICTLQLAELFSGGYLKNLNISLTKQDKFVKQRSFCGGRKQTLFIMPSNTVISFIG
jgi:hypothetical protein